MIYTYAFPETVEKASFVVTTKVPPGTRTEDCAGIGSLHGWREIRARASVPSRRPRSRQPLTLAFPRTRAKAFRLVINIATLQKKAAGGAGHQPLQRQAYGEFLHQVRRVRHRLIMPTAIPPTGQEGSIAPQQVLDLTS